jgi:hypothetical protein
LDVSMEETAVCVVDEAGGIVAEAKVASDPAAIAACLERWSGTLSRVCNDNCGVRPATIRVAGF